MDILLTILHEFLPEKGPKDIISEFCYAPLPNSATWGKIVFTDSTKYPIQNLEGPTITLGRSGCSILVDFILVSKKHCKITRQMPQGFVFLEDCSTNGTWINGKWIHKKNVQLKHKDVVHLSRSTKSYPEEVAFIVELLDSSEVLGAVTKIGKYDLGDLIDRGTFSKVYHCTESGEQKTKTQLAIKMTEIKQAKKISFREEADLLRTLDHPHIVKLVEVFETADYFCIVQELLSGGPLFDKLIETGDLGLDEDYTRIIFRQIVSALTYLHDLKIIHRDLKLENVVFTNGKQQEIKLVDFGLSCKIPDGTLLNLQCGTPMYVAPEVLHLQGYNQSVDLWSLGVVLFCMLCGQPPFDQRKHKTIESFLEVIKKGEYKIPEDSQQKLSPEAIDLIKQLLQMDTKKRITLQEVQTHPWVTAKILEHKLETTAKPQQLVLEHEVETTAKPQQLVLEHKVEAQEEVVPDPCDWIHIPTQVSNSLPTPKPEGTVFTRLWNLLSPK